MKEFKPIVLIENNEYNADAEIKTNSIEQLN